nr:TlpA family protein disulfide reductase [Geodermatophilaceae bacterium]
MRLKASIAAVVAAFGLLAGCTTGSGAVDVSNGVEFRFVAGTPGGEVIDEGDRASAPEFSGVLLDGSD